LISLPSENSSRKDLLSPSRVSRRGLGVKKDHAKVWNTKAGDNDIPGEYNVSVDLGRKNS